LIVDIALSKYCDLIPMERYTQIAGREGLEDLSAQSLIRLTHHLVKLLADLHELIQNEVRFAEFQAI
jgi:hypothetical protein